MSEEAREPADRIFFVHIQKTAGTSFVFRLRKHFGRAAIYPGESDKGNVAAVLSVEHLLERLRTSGDQFRVITGHFPLCTIDVIGGEFTTLTVLRDPVDRTLSYLRHHREQTPGDQRRPLEDIYEDPFRFHGHINNHMVKMFSLTAAEMTAGMLTRVEFSKERLETAKESLARVDVVGIQERFDAFCDELTRRFGWGLGEPLHTNRSEWSEVSVAFRTRIAEENALDVELYEYAKRLAAGSGSNEVTRPA
jgi:hypothetical protein